VDTTGRAEIQVGSVVRIRAVRPLGPGLHQAQVSSDRSLEQVVTIVASDSDMGLWKLSPRTPLGRALLGHQIGDIVIVRLQDVSAEFEVVAIDPQMRR
jgi:hypothetical protein